MSGVESISPELALVDQELRRRARKALPDALDGLHAPLRGAADERPQRQLSYRRTAPVVAVVLACFAVVLTSGITEPASEQAAMRDTSTAEAHVDQAPVRLRWKPVPGAVFYNVILWRGQARELDVWPKSASAQLPRDRLEPGTYRWFVYPVLRRDEKRRFGALAAQGTVKV